MYYFYFWIVHWGFLCGLMLNISCVGGIFFYCWVSILVNYKLVLPFYKAVWHDRAKDLKMFISFKPVIPLKIYLKKTIKGIYVCVYTHRMFIVTLLVIIKVWEWHRWPIVGFLQLFLNSLSWLLPSEFSHVGHCP